MFKILANLKNNWISVVLIILLLCLQAWTDLTLPDYTSKIVNTGIQAGGIEYIAPTIIRKEQMDNILLFTENDKQILSNYKLISMNTLSKQEYGKKLKEYPELKNQDLYELKKLNKKQKEDLDELILNPFMIVYFLENEEYASAIKSNIFSNNVGTIETNNSTNVNELSLLDLIKTMSEEERQEITNNITKEIEKKLGVFASQTAVNATKEEYKKVGINTDDIQNKYILKTGISMIGIAVISMTTAIIIMFLSSRVAASLGKTLRDKIFKKVLKFTKKEFTEFSTASLITRTTNDIQQIQMLIASAFRVIVYAPIMGIGGFLKVLANSNNSMAWVIGVAIGSIIFVISILVSIAMPKFKKFQDLIDRLNLVSREILTGLPVIRAFNTEKREEKRFDKANKDLMKTNIFISRAISIMMPALMFIMNSIMLLIIWVGGHKVEEGIMQVGDMMAFIQYTMHIVISFLFISLIAVFLPRATVSARRINEVLEKEPSIKDKDETKDFDNSKKGYVEFKDVSFRYPDADTEILEDISFTAEPGKTTAIIGSTGSRKIYTCKFNTTFL